MSSAALIKLLFVSTMSQLFRSLTSLFNSQQLDSSGATSLVLERLYYADGRQNPSHPRHGSFEGLSLLD